MVDVDFSQPLPTLLRNGTAAAHAHVEKSKGAAWLTRGELDKEEYARFLIMLWHVYDALEQALDKHQANLTLNPTYNPHLLRRAPALASDISSLLEVSETEWKSHPVATALLSNPPPTFIAYISRISSLSSSPADVPRLLAHAYVRYLGDLSGGQQIRRRIEKAYGLEEGQGTQFYKFSDLEGTKRDANMGDMKKIKEWYREGMDKGAGDDKELKAAILDEAIKAFELNAGLFSVLRGPTRPPSLSPSSNEALASSLGVPLTPISPSMESPMSPSVETSTAKGDHRAVEAEPSPYSSLSSNSVINFIVAVGLAHFLIIVLGLSGERGWTKLTWVAKQFGVEL